MDHNRTNKTRRSQFEPAPRRGQARKTPSSPSNSAVASVIRIRAGGYGPNARSKVADPTSAIVSETVSDGISITVTVVSLELVTYSVLPFGLISDGPHISRHARRDRITPGD